VSPQEGQLLSKAELGTQVGSQAGAWEREKVRYYWGGGRPGATLHLPYPFSPLSLPPGENCGQGWRAGDLGPHALHAGPLLVAPGAVSSGGAGPL